MNIGFIFIIFIGIAGFSIYNAFKENEKKRQEEEKRVNSTKGNNAAAPINKGGTFFDLAEEIKKQKAKELEARRVKTEPQTISPKSNEMVRENKSYEALKARTVAGGSTTSSDKMTTLRAFSSESESVIGNKEALKNLNSIMETDDENMRIARVMIMGDVLNKPKYRR